jgi:hypothetical protein
MPFEIAWVLSIACGLAAVLGFLVGPALVLRKRTPAANPSRIFAFLLGICVFAYVRLVLASPQLLPFATIALVGIGAVLIVVTRRAARRR